jgi:SAM-dependent methyltransferase
VLTATDRAKCAAHWDAVPAEGKPREWWHFGRVLRHVNRRLSGADSDAHAAGIVRLIGMHAPGRTFCRAVSVGCGSAHKEHALSVAGVVGDWRLFELSPVRAAEASRRMGPFAEVVCGDGLADTRSGYDLAYWDNAMHHMPDVRAAMDWTRNVLSPGGGMALFDYTGPNRFQFGEKWTRAVNAARATFPAHWFGGKPRAWSPIRAQHWIDHDPTEAADSANILPALVERWPGVAVSHCGGLCYSCAMRGLWGNVRPEDGAAVEAMLALDSEHADQGRSIYTGAWAWLTT